MQFLDIVYLVLWALLALLCLGLTRKLGPVMLIVSGFFVFMFVWYLINDLSPVNMFDGVYNLVFRGIALVFLGILVAAYLYIRKHPKE